MKPPFKKDLIKIGRSYSYASGLHTNSQLYKHIWQIFTLDSKLEGEDFLEHGPRLSTAACMAKLQEIKTLKDLYILYGSKRPRRFPGMPFDPNNKQWHGVQWAPALQDDPDPMWNGNK